MKFCGIFLSDEVPKKIMKFFCGGGNQENQKKTDDVAGGGNAVMTADHMGLQALPEGCIATIVSLTTPRDAGMMFSVSRTFMSTVESDAVWGRFIPPDIDTILSSSSLSGSVQPTPQLPHVSPSSASKTKKELFLALCDNPVLIEHGKLSFSLDKWTGKKCYMIAARALSIFWSNTPQWQWISLPYSRFPEVAAIVCGCVLDIRGKIETRMLSPSTLYKASLVFKPTPRGLIGEEATAGAIGFEPAKVTVGLIGKVPTNHEVFLDDRKGRLNWGRILGLQASQPRKINKAQYPEKRNDGWLEVELGEFFCEGDEDGELEMICLDDRGEEWKRGLMFQGIEIRPVRMQKSSGSRLLL